ncbi:hypothetical protein MPK66_gp077 [Erwinia phage pEa_SNUABM_2]|uniref:Uncharacterized protein n=1 Tax=Erwinia phage pEa_SNUABM_2 TaxID=2869547 RepID=A0AAE8C335_9CAUD|nr:hypothetical protein MPK66_gp077 [Erwinia phage pEa_SNUABM_2]QZE59321.1 hypothetical protein pEaSNUABM2_00077 [Erwinia phage pEa_SNUABM_2]QZE59657.1 hypothetical protein pEaSNUABM39_00077 [Erwinia phage pEa_SNUABM_39]
MKMLPATANAMQRNAYSSLVSSSVPTNMTAVANAILFYTGTMPTKAELQTLIGDGTQIPTANAIYQRPGLLTTARAADYVGGVTGNKAAMTLAANNVPVMLASAFNMRLNATFSDYRASYFTKDATPTWCIVIGGATASINVQTGVTDVPAAFVTVCSVGNENSNADLKLVGGKVYANSTTPTDQSKAVIINDLVLKFA